MIFTSPFAEWMLCKVWNQRRAVLFFKCPIPQCFRNKCSLSRFTPSISMEEGRSVIGDWLANSSHRFKKYTEQSVTSKNELMHALLLSSIGQRELKHRTLYFLTTVLANLLNKLTRAGVTGSCVTISTCTRVTAGRCVWTLSILITLVISSIAFVYILVC